MKAMRRQVDSKWLEEGYVGVELLRTDEMR